MRVTQSANTDKNLKLAGVKMKTGDGFGEGLRFFIIFEDLMSPLRKSKRMDQLNVFILQ